MSGNRETPPRVAVAAGVGARAGFGGFWGGVGWGGFKGRGRGRAAPMKGARRGRATIKSRTPRARARYLVGKIFRAWSTPREKVENHLSIGYF